MRVQASALTLRNGGEKFEVKSEQQTLVEKERNPVFTTTSTTA
tara:strand:+ start:255 stop:383 length:129 start_codon:yes stop_codon:yes gene_type:complete